MAITCSWEKPLGYCFSEYDEERKHPITIWGGGNCLAVFTTGKEKNLANFIIDEEHFKNCKYNGTEFIDIVISYARKKESQRLIKLLAKAGFEFTTCRNEIIKIEE